MTYLPKPSISAISSGTGTGSGAGVGAGAGGELIAEMDGLGRCVTPLLGWYARRGHIDEYRGIHRIHLFEHLSTQ